MVLSDFEKKEECGRLSHRLVNSQTINPNIYIFFYPTTNNLVSLERKECIRYLGVLIDSNLYWKYHIDYISLKTRLALTSVLRPFGVTRWIDVLFGVTGMSDYL